MWAWVAFWSFCSVMAICRCVYRVVHVRRLGRPPEPECEWSFNDS